MIDRPGERAEESRRNRFWLLMAGFMLVGGVIGAALVIVREGDGSLPAVAAIAVAALLVVALGGGSWYFYRDIDELERRDNLIAGVIALHFYVILYPCWYFLWKGGLVPEPDHEILYIATLIVMTLAYFWKKIRP
jgi:hypothetical protein